MKSTRPSAARSEPPPRSARRAYRQMKRAAGAALTRAAIVAAARRCFTARGFGGTTIDAVAREAGVARGTVLRHYPSKAALLVSVAQAAGAHLDDVKRALALGDPVAAARAVVRAACRYWSSDPEFFRRMAALRASETGLRTDRAAGKRADAAARAGPEASPEEGRRAAVEELARRLARAGALRRGWSRDGAAALLWLLTSFAAFDRLHGDRRLGARKTAEILVAVCDATVLRADSKSA